MGDSGFEIVADNSGAVKEAVREAVESALTAVGQHIEGEAKDELSNAPKRIDTGLLRNSITYAVSGHQAAIAAYSADDGGKAGSYSGAAPSESGGGKAVYIGSNVEYAA